MKQDRRDIYLEHDGDHFIAIPGSHASPHFQNHASDTPNINFKVISLSLCIDDFRSHPKDRSLHGSEGTIVIRPFGDAKI